MRSIVQRRRVVATQLRDHRQEETPVPERLTRESLKEITKASDEILKKLRNISGALDFKAKLDCHGMVNLYMLHICYHLIMCFTARNDSVASRCIDGKQRSNRNAHQNWN